MKFLSGSVSRRGRDVVPALHDDCVGPLTQQAVEPVAHAAVRLSSRHPRSEANLRLDVPKRGSAIKLLRRTRLLPAGDGQEKSGRKQAEQVRRKKKRR